MMDSSISSVAAWGHVLVACFALHVWLKPEGCHPQVVPSYTEDFATAVLYRIKLKEQ
jgi:hypothetical protein